MRENIDYKCIYWPDWSQDFEFCSYEPDKCPYGEEFCWCKDLEVDELIDMDTTYTSDEDLLPF